MCDCTPAVYRLQPLPGSATVRRFLESAFLPARPAARRRASRYRHAVERLAEFTACEPTLDQLAPELLDRCGAWVRAGGRRASTVWNLRIYLNAVRRAAVVARSTPAVYRLQPLPGSLTVRSFLESAFFPARPAVRPSAFRRAVERLAAFTGCEPTLDQLAAGLIDRCVAWELAPGRRASTARNLKNCLRSLRRAAVLYALCGRVPRPRSQRPKRAQRTEPVANVEPREGPPPVPRVPIVAVEADASLPLFTFYRDVFAPLLFGPPARRRAWQDRVRHQRGRYSYQSAIRSFRAAVMREPTLADLTADNFREFRRSRSRRGSPLTKTRAILHRLAAMAELAVEFGLLDAAPDWTGEPDVVILGTCSPRTLRRFLEDRYIPLRLTLGSPRTIEDLRSAVRKLDAFLGHEVTLDELNDDRVQDFAVWALRAGLKPPTVNKLLRNTLSIWRYAWRKRLVPELPRDIDFVRELKQLPECWSISELTRIIAVCEDLDGRVAGVPAPVWWPALLLLAFDTGLRIGAVLGLRRDDLDLETGWLSVRAEIQKQKAGQAFLLHRDTLEHVRRLLASAAPHELLFRCPYRGGRGHAKLWRNYTRILQQAGLPHGPKDKFHRIRRTTATYVADALGEQQAQRTLGHSSLQVTRRYLDPRKMASGPQPVEVLPRPDSRTVHVDPTQSPGHTRGGLPDYTSGGRCTAAP